MVELRRPFRVLWANRLAPEKNVQTIVRAIALCPEWFYLRIAGTGAAESRVKKLVAELGVSDQVTFLGHISQDEVGEEMKKCDVVVVPSIIAEALSRSVIDCAKYHKPIIVSGNCGRMGWEMVCPALDFWAWAKTFTVLNEEISFYPTNERIRAVEKSVKKDSFFHIILKGHTHTLGD